MNRLQETSRKLALASGSPVAAATRAGGGRRVRTVTIRRIIERLRRHPDRYSR